VTQVRTKQGPGPDSDALAGRDEGTPAGHGRPRKRAHWYTQSLIRLGIIGAVAIIAVVTVSPADGAAGTFAAFARAVRHFAAGSNGTGLAYAGTQAVGALFTTSGGQPDKHFCSASVVDSPNGDLVVTAAHCVTGTSGTIDFVPGYDNGSMPYGVWTVTKIYVDQAWSSSQNQDDDFAILKVQQTGTTTPIQDVTGGEKLVTGEPADGTQVQVIGYPDASNQAITCQNKISEPMTDQLQFDCGGYTDGTSGGPFLTDVNSRTGQGSVIGLIGGYEQGGDTPQVSYSAVLGSNMAALYQTAVAGG
jgi:V8-like Glu-specific endopeptidase